MDRNEYARQWRQKNLEKCREREKERSRARRRERREAINRGRRQHYATDDEHRSKVLAASASERARAKAWRVANPELSAKINRDRNAEIRKDVFAEYGGKCACCGEIDSLFLTIDHINNDGAIERREEGKGAGVNMYRLLKKQGFPKDRYRLLCFNCNCGRARNGGICPHRVLP